MRHMGSVILAAACAAAPMASAQPVRGLYLGAGVGADFKPDQPIGGTNLDGALTSRYGSAGFDPGVAAVVNLGWGFGNGLRAELEGSVRQNGIDAIHGAAASGGTELKYGAMVNVLYDLDLGGPVTPYAGIGIGEQTVAWKNGRAIDPGSFIRLQHEDMTFAYQAILGVSVATPILGLSLTAEYRFLGSSGHTVYGQYFAPGLDAPAEMRLRDDFDHSLMLGVRYAFDAPPPPAPATVVPAAAPPATRTYLVFFDWDRADLSDRARQVIAEAARATAQTALTRIEVQGHADRSGAEPYNQALSERRAGAVAAELVRDGVPRGAIVTSAFGATRPLVPTAAGVREPQNRRVEIVLG